MNPEAYVEDAMRACLPDGVPLAFTLNSAWWINRRRKRAGAKVTMFDGHPASIEVWAWSDGMGTAHMWTEMPGGDASFEGGAWVRIDREADNRERGQ